MKEIILNTLRGLKKRLIQYIGIGVLLIVTASSMSGMYNNANRVKVAFYQVADHSVQYDYRFNTKILHDFKDSDNALITLKTIIKAILPKGTKGEDNPFVDKITKSDIENNIIPEISDADKAKQQAEEFTNYLYDWGANYKLIFSNYILENIVKSDVKLKNYGITRSFLKSFDSIQKNLNFSIEDAFVIQKPGEKPNFDFSPYRDGFNLIYLTDGHLPKDEKEAVINPQFAAANNIKLGEQYNFTDTLSLKVVGFGYSYYAITGPRSNKILNPKPENTTQVFTSKEVINNYLKQKGNSLLTQLNMPFFLKVKNNNSTFADLFERIYSAYFNFNYGTLLIANDDDFSGGQIKSTFKMQDIVFSAITAVITLIAIFIVLFYVRKEIELQKRQFGVIKALGYNNNQISVAYCVLIFLISFVSIFIGLLLGVPLQLKFNSLTGVGWFLPIAFININVVVVILGLVVTPILLALCTYLQTFVALGHSPLELIYGLVKNGNTKIIAGAKKPFRKWDFKSRLSIAFSLKSVGKLIITGFIFIFASFLLLFQVIATDVFDNKVSNLYNYLNSDIYSANQSLLATKSSNRNLVSEYNYNWIYDNQLPPPDPSDINNKAITASDFRFDNANKKNKITIFLNNSKSYYFSGKEVNELYQNVWVEPKGDKTKAKQFVDPSAGTHPDWLPFNKTAEEIVDAINNFFASFKEQTGLNPDGGSKNRLPGISIGQNIISHNEYPNLEFSISMAKSWFGHTLNKQHATRIQACSLYNEKDVKWKDWFNLKEIKGRNINKIFDNSHILSPPKKVTYTDNFGETKTKNAFVIPSAISKALATLNGYKINNEILAIVNVNNNFIPVIFKVDGIISNNLDSSKIYVNYYDLCEAVKLNSNESENGLFNTVYSKQKNLILNSYVDIASTDGKYDINLLNKAVSINQISLVYPMFKEIANKLFTNLVNVLDITKWLTIIGLAFVLIIVINMILDSNILIIAMMKSLGYRINETNSLIIGAYIFTLFISFIVGVILAYGVWNIVIYFAALFSGVVFLVPVRLLTIFVSFVIIFGILAVGYSAGLYFVKFKSLPKLLQSD